jgi:hypothetical protein
LHLHAEMSALRGKISALKVMLIGQVQAGRRSDPPEQGGS